MAVRPYIRTFDSNDYWHQLASKEVCLSIAWSSDYYVAQARAREDGTGAHLAFMLPKEGSNITYNAFLIPASAPHPRGRARVSQFHPRAAGHRRDHQRHPLRQRQPGGAALRRRAIYLNDPAVYPPPELRARLYLPAELGPDYDRLRTRVWTRIKTGQ